MGAAGIRKRAAPEAFPKRVGMDEPHFDGRADSGKQEDVLQDSLKVKRDTATLFQE